MEKLRGNDQENRLPPDGISIGLDGFGDIFSDFDSRSYDKRVLSDDFLAELRKISQESESGVRSFHLILPDRERDSKTEAVVLKRLLNHFRINSRRAHKKLAALIRKGLLFSVLGLLLLLLAGYISYNSPVKAWLHLILVICEPAGWFLVWTGCDLLLNDLKMRKKNLRFFEKMSHSKIEFISR